MSCSSEFLNEVTKRGFVYQSTPLAELTEHLKTPRTGYVGFDITAPSLHVGSLTIIMLLRWFQYYGHHPIILLGGGTTKVGDPSYKDKTRPLLSDEEIQTNTKNILWPFHQILKTTPQDATFVNNDDWLKELHYIPFLRDVGRYFSVNRMLSFDFIRSRLESQKTLSFLELNYMLLQAYDFAYLFKQHNCTLQFGGSDQWANIINGIEFIKKTTQSEAFAMTWPLVTTASGKKMGKTEGGAVWLNPERFSPYDYWQFWRNTPDTKVIEYLKLFTTLPLDEIDRLSTLQGSDLNTAKKILADQATQLLHGPEVLPSIHTTSASFFDKTAPNDLSSEEEPRMFHVKHSDLEKGISVLELCLNEGWIASKSQGRQLIRGGGIRLDQIVVEDELKKLTLEDINPNKTVQLSLGKKKHYTIGCKR